MLITDNQQIRLINRKTLRLHFYKIAMPKITLFLSLITSFFSYSQDKISQIIISPVYFDSAEHLTKCDSFTLKIQRIHSIKETTYDNVMLSTLVASPFVFSPSNGLTSGEYIFSIKHSTLSGKEYIFYNNGDIEFKTIID